MCRNETVLNRLKHEFRPTRESNVAALNYFGQITREDGVTRKDAMLGIDTGNKETMTESVCCRPTGWIEKLLCRCRTPT